MLADKVLLQRSDRGEIGLYDSRDKFHASFKNGQWINTLVFQDHELEEFTLIRDDSEIDRVLAEARAVLNRPLDTSHQGCSESA